MKKVGLREYIQEVLKNAIYEKGEVLDVVVAVAPDLPGCFTQGRTFEEAREMLIDAIETWILAGISEGEEMPPVNGCRLAFEPAPKKGREDGKAKARVKARTHAKTARARVGRTAARS